MMAEVANGEVVPSVEILDYDDLFNGSLLSDQISAAFGCDGLGILFVRGVPGYTDARATLLPLAQKFARLEEVIQEKYVHPDSCYSFGWSHGKEKLQGRPDLSKGSYYANPQYDRPIDDEEIIAKYPSFVHPNIWPKDDLPELEPAFKQLGQIIVSVGILIAKQCDSYVHSQCPSYESSTLESIIKESRCCKARLLHYFSNDNIMTSEKTNNEHHFEKENIEHCKSNNADASDTPNTSDASTDISVKSPLILDDDFSSWCGWHHDHGSLTGLTAALLSNEEGDMVPGGDPSSGLYVVNRRSELVKITIPVDCIAFQIGETAQIHSGGILQATPHAVRASTMPSMRGITRETFGVFMEPMWDYPMSVPVGVNPLSAQTPSAAANLPRGVPSISSRWTVNQNFGEFTRKCLEAYH